MVLTTPSLIGAARTRILTPPRIFCRHKSIHASILRGAQNDNPFERSGRRQRDSPVRDPFGDREGGRRAGSYRDDYSGSRDRRDSRPDFRREHRTDGYRRDTRGDVRTGPQQDRRDPRGFRQDSGAETHRHRYTSGQDRGSRNHTSRSSGRDSDESIQREYVPESLPYTTAASEFLYGVSSVDAAIRAQRRKLYKLWVEPRGQAHERVQALMARAKAAKLSVRAVGDEYVPVFDRASAGRPHNGFILEASPLPQPPIVQLGSSSLSGATFNVRLGKQSKEDELVNGTQTKYPYKAAGWRHPFILYVDGVLDEGNLGAIARSAYFMGVDAIATPTRGSAPWSHIAVKASAGAVEALPVFAVNEPANFLTQSAREGWRIYASDAIPTGEQADLTTSCPITEKQVDTTSEIIFSHARGTKRLPVDFSPLSMHPTILMMGAEGTGLRASLLNSAHFKVGIRAGREADEIGVDSLNVSVAASLLCFEFLKKPLPQTKKPSEWLF